MLLLHGNAKAFKPRQVFRDVLGAVVRRHRIWNIAGAQKHKQVRHARKDFWAAPDHPIHIEDDGFNLGKVQWFGHQVSWPKRWRIKLSAAGSIFSGSSS